MGETVSPCLYETGDPDSSNLSCFLSFHCTLLEVSWSSIIFIVNLGENNPTAKLWMSKWLALTCLQKGAIKGNGLDLDHVIKCGGNSWSWLQMWRILIISHKFFYGKDFIEIIVKKVYTLSEHSNLHIHLLKMS